MDCHPRAMPPLTMKCSSPKTKPQSRPFLSPQRTEYNRMGSMDRVMEPP